MAEREREKQIKIDTIVHHDLALLVHLRVLQSRDDILILIQY